MIEVATTSDPLARLRLVLGDAPLVSDDAGDLHVEVPPERLAETCARVHGTLGAPLATMVGLDDRQRSGTFRLIYVFSAPGRWVSVETPVDPAHPHFPAVTPRLPAAHWYEREVQDLLGLVPDGHPQPHRLVLHDDWPEGVYPLRKDFDPTRPVPRVAGPVRRFHRLHGEGMTEIPVGPIHAGVIEPGHFRFAAVGEVVLHLETRLFYTHRGIEKLAEGQTVDRVLQIAERVCGACSFSHAVAYCQALEILAGASLSDRAQGLRTLWLELERLYNHVGDLGNICAGTGFAVGAMRGGFLKEGLQRLNEYLTGSRFLRGACRVGGVRRDLEAGPARQAAGVLRRLEADFAGFVDLLLGNDGFVDRLRATGHVSLEAARDLGAVGVAARASGLDRDLRRDRPYAAYGRYRPSVAVQRGGDVWARLQVRIDEALVSFALVRAILDDLPAGPLSVPIRSLPPYRAAVSATESPRGENVHWVRTGDNGQIDRYRIRSASYCNWPIVALAVPGNMVPDFPLINKSFELCYSCLDR